MQRQQPLGCEEVAGHKHPVGGFRPPQHPICPQPPTQVDVLLHNSTTNTILSGGSDGYVRLWDFNKVSAARLLADPCPCRGRRALAHTTVRMGALPHTRTP